MQSQHQHIPKDNPTYDLSDLTSDILSGHPSTHRIIIGGTSPGRTRTITDILRHYPADTKLIIVEDGDEIQIPIKSRNALRVSPSGGGANDAPMPPKSFSDMLITIKPDVIAFRHTTSITTRTMIRMAERTATSIFAIADTPADTKVRPPALQRLMNAGFRLIRPDSTTPVSA